MLSTTSDEFITLGEFIALVLLLCAPAVLLGLAGQIIWYRRRGWFAREKTLALTSLPLACVLTVTLAALLWLAVPHLAADVITSNAARFLFWPGIVSGALVFPLVTAAVGRIVRTSSHGAPGSAR